MVFSVLNKAPAYGVLCAEQGSGLWCSVLNKAPAYGISPSGMNSLVPSGENWSEPGSKLSPLSVWLTATQWP